MYRSQRYESKILPTMKAWASGWDVSQEMSQIRTVCQKSKFPCHRWRCSGRLWRKIEGYQRVIDGARAVIDNYRPQIVVDPEWPLRWTWEI